MTRLFHEWLDRRGLTGRLTTDQQSQLLAYLLLLERWNQQINLTGSLLTSNPDAALDRLILEPVEFQLKFQLTPRKVLDIGSGSGSPALPFLICCPSAELTMIEARQKKAVFLREASRAINLNTRVEACRFEDFAQQSHPGFDTVITRAVRVDQGLLATIDRMLATDGRFYYFTSKDAVTKHRNPSHFVTTTTDFVNPARFRVVTHNRTR